MKKKNMRKLMEHRRSGKKHKKGKENKKEATREEDTECDLFCGNKDTVALTCCKTKKLCAKCLKKMMYATIIPSHAHAIFSEHDVKMSNLAIVSRCPFCRTKLLYDRPKDFENGNKAIVKSMMLRPQESPAEVFKTPNGDTLCLLDLKLKTKKYSLNQEKVGEVLFKFSPSKGPKSELKGCILLNETSLFNSFPLAQRLHRTTGQ